jgi:glycosyltransferase involved in cell wall biosynthesis
MKVLLVVGSYPPEYCGVGDYTQKLAQELAVIPDIKVGVLTRSSLDREKDSTETVELIDTVHHWNLSELLKIILTIKKWKPNLLHVQYPSQGYNSLGLPSILPLVCRFLGINVVITWHEPQKNLKKHRVKSFFYYLSMCVGANGLIFVRPNYIDLLSKTYRVLMQGIPQLFIPNSSPLPTSPIPLSSREAISCRYKGDYQRLIVFFGFVNPNKGIELIFDIANSATDFLVIAGSVKDQAYGEELIELALLRGWKVSQINFLGFIPAAEAADLLAVADAVILPFLEGGGDWNTSIHSALAQGTLVVTTAECPRGDDPECNLYTCAPNDINAMRTALNQHAGRRIAPFSTNQQWRHIATEHLNFYKKLLNSQEILKK